MAKVDVKIGYSELNGLVKQLEKLTDATPEILKQVVYQGGAVVGDKMKKEVKGLPIIPEFAHKKGVMLNGGTDRQINGPNGLVESMGLAPIRHYGGWLNTKVGFDGYNSVKTKKYPQGQPNMLIARSINSGTSFRSKNPFVMRAANNAKTEAVQAMQRRLEYEINSIIDY